LSNIKKLKVAILGSGNIGTDLLVKVMRSPYLECSMFIGRRFDSPGMKKAGELGAKLFNNSIQAIVDDPGSCELIFDATTARDHLRHWPIIEKLGKTVIDMTPSKVGKMIVPAVNLDSLSRNKNMNMVSCGGQASIPLACALTKAQENIEYIEVVSSISSLSAGPGTRVNIDEYIENTEEGLRTFSGCKKVKVILILNPAKPCIDMQTTISAKVKNPDMEKVKSAVAEMEKKLQRYVPGYKIVVPPVYENNRIIIMVRVRGLGDYLPVYAGNLDIINCAAIATAEAYAINLSQRGKN
jgi:acetaldehyde dehydrogenase